MRTYQALKQAQAAVKEVICARDNNDRQVLRARPVEARRPTEWFHPVRRGSRACHAIRAASAICLRPHRSVPRIWARGSKRSKCLRRFGRNETAKRKAGDSNRQLSSESLDRTAGRSGSEVDQMQEILGLAFAFVMLSGRAANAAEVKSYCEPSKARKCARDGGNDLVVERAAVERMRVADVDDPLRRAAPANRAPARCRPRLPSTSNFSIDAGIGSTSSSKLRSNAKPLDDFAFDQMAVDDFVDVVLHRHRCTRHLPGRRRCKDLPGSDPGSRTC